MNIQHALISSERIRMFGFRKKVHDMYYDEDINCARVMLTCLGEMLGVKIEEQLYIAAAGMHGAGGYRAQCGLAEGALLFISVYCHSLGLSEEAAVSACYQFGESFEKEFGSLRCRELRPQGFNADDEPHMCEGLTCKAVEFAYIFCKERVGILCEE